MQKKSVTLLVLIFSALLLSTTFSNIVAFENTEKISPFKTNDDVIIKALDFLRNQQTEEGSFGSYFISSWTAMAISSVEEDPNNWNNLVSYLEEHTSLINEAKASDWERMTLAIVACNKNPRNFSGLNFIEKIKSFFDGTQIFSLNNPYDDIFGILALIAAGEDKNSEIIQSISNYIKNEVRDDRGWGNVDSTSASIMALIAAGEDKNSEIIENAISFLKTKQVNNGGFEFRGTTNAGTTAWAIQAIVAAGKNPSSIYWINNGSSPIDYLLSLQQDDGSFNWSENQRINPVWMTAYVIPALIGKPYPVKIMEISSDDDIIDNDDESEKNNQNETNDNINFPDEENSQSIDWLTITKPDYGAIYFYNKEIKLPIQGILVIGRVEIIAIVDKEVEKVNFYLNDDLKHTDFKSPFVWYFNEKGVLSINKISVKAYLYDDKILISLNKIITKVDAALENHCMEKGSYYVIKHIKGYVENIECFIDSNCEFDEKRICIFNLFPILH